METIRTLLPKLDLLRNKPVTAPERWARDRSGPESFQIGEKPSNQGQTTRKRAALFGNPGANLAQAWSRGEVGIRLGVIDQLHSSLYPHLPPKRFPVKCQRRFLVVLKLVSLGGIEVRVEDEAVLTPVKGAFHVNTLEKNHPPLRDAVPSDRGKTCRLGQLHPAMSGGLPEPP